MYRTKIAFRLLPFFVIFAGITIVLSACHRQQPDTSKENVLLTGDPKIDELTKKILADGNQPALYYQRGVLLYNAQKYDQSALDIEKAISLDSSKISYFQALTDAYLDGAKSEKALTTLRHAVSRFPDSIRVHLSLAETELILKQYAPAMKSLQTIFDKHPNHPDAYFLMGMVFKETGDTIRAMNSFQEAVKGNPDMTKGYIELGNLSVLKNQPVALRYFSNVLSVDSTNYDALNGTAWFYHRKRNFSEAMKWYHKIVVMHPQNADVHYNIGELYLAQEKYDESLKSLGTCLSLDPTHADAWYVRGWILQKQGKKDDAIKSYRQTLAFAPDYNRAKEGLLSLGVKD